MVNWILDEMENDNFFVFGFLIFFVSFNENQLGSDMKYYVGIYKNQKDFNIPQNLKNFICIS